MGTAIDMAFDGATLAACPLSALVFSFAFYGFCGWAWESTVCAMLNQGRFANSGFLLGPCCPIYGVGGIACWLLLRGIPDASGPVCRGGACMQRNRVQRGPSIGKDNRRALLGLLAPAV